MTNEQRAKEAAIKINTSVPRYTVYAVNEHRAQQRIKFDADIILTSLNAATKEKDTRITKLNDALKPFAKAYKHGYGAHDTDDNKQVYWDLHYDPKNMPTVEVDLRVHHFRNAAAVIEEG